MQCAAAILTIIGIPALCILGGQAGILRLIFPFLSVAVGGFLLWRSKPSTSAWSSGCGSLLHF
jgi:hypothetical protein